MVANEQPRVAKEIIENLTVARVNVPEPLQSPKALGIAWL